MMKNQAFIQLFRQCRLAILVCSLTVLSACTSTPKSTPDFERSYLERTQTQEKEGIRVTAAVPSAAESKEIFGQALYKRGVQPVWLNIENKRDDIVSFLPVGLDPAYYSPNEVANLNVKDKATSNRGSMIDLLYFDNSIANSIDAGGQNSGFIFSKLDEGTKSFNVDIIGDFGMVTFTFFIPVPGLNLDHHHVDWHSIYPGDDTGDRSRDELMAELESIICCVTDKKNKEMGDPLNLVIIGEPRDIYYAFIRAGWDETEVIHKGSLWKTMKSFLSGGEYRYSPVSSLYVFDRPQDVAFQRARSNIHERNHLRLWLAPARYEGKPVWIGQISRDIGVRFTKKTITTHKIDPDVDETREFLLENLAYSQVLKKYAYVEGVGEAPLDDPRGNLTGDPYFTDGYRLVLWLTSSPVDLSDLEFEDWKSPPHRRSP